MILMEDARRLRRDLHMRPFEGDRRVYLILDAHLLRDDSANALLKSLEEPPDYGVFVLVSDHAEGMLPTIRSRVQTVPFRRFSTAELAAHTGDPAAARAALGSLDRAELLVHDGDASERHRGYLDLARRSITGEGFDPAEASAAITGAAAAAGKRAGALLKEQGEQALETVDDPRAAQDAREAAGRPRQARLAPGRAGRAARGAGHDRLVVPGRARGQSGSRGHGGTLGSGRPRDRGRDRRDPGEADAGDLDPVRHAPVARHERLSTAGRRGPLP